MREEKTRICFSILKFLYKYQNLIVKKFIETESSSNGIAEPTPDLLRGFNH
jgi:hypothetical protein